MLRINFHEELGKVEEGLLQLGQLVGSQLERVLVALDQHNADLAKEVITADDRVDDAYLETQTRVLNLLALQAPVAGDLRLVSAILHSNMHLERMGDLCVNVAKFVLNQDPYPSASGIVARFGDMAAQASGMLQLALKAFAERNAELAERLPEQDEVIDGLNRGMLHELKEYVGDEASFEWASNLVLVARYLERFGDHVVDIGEQVAFLATGVFREFTDASHPDRPLD